MNIWRNPGEIPGNSVDDDGNGFIDDVRGWDFTDAPGYIGFGDYTVRDNDPMDEAGHGTHVAGIAAARGNNNSLGVAGVAWQCKIMPLRAGFRSNAGDFLEDDDIASALVYAADNGARVINMSFGDNSLSYLLQDAVRYASARGCVLVAAAGNSPVEGLMYPARCNEVIAVGTVDQYDNAIYSNYGENLDVLAPGTGILSTLPYTRLTGTPGRYGTMGGSSMAAPFVSGLAALLLSRNPGLTAEQVRDLLRSSADDLGVPGWDALHGAGCINVQAALQANHPVSLSLLGPASGSAYAHNVPIIVSVYGALVQDFSVDYTSASDPRWRQVVPAQARQTLADTFTWHVDSLPAGDYTLRLSVKLVDKTYREARARITVDRTPPRLTEVAFHPRLRKNSYRCLVTWQTNEPTIGTVFFKRQDAAAYRAAIDRYNYTEHFTDITDQLANSGTYLYYVRAEDLAGLIDSSTVDTFFFGQDRAVGQPALMRQQALPSGVVYSGCLDLDHDGLTECLVMQYPDQGPYGQVKIYERSGAGLTLAAAVPDSFFIAAGGDLDHDGRSELVGIRNTATLLYKSPTANSFPTIKAQTLPDVYARFLTDSLTDLDHDQQHELVAVGTADTLMVYESSGDTLIRRARIAHPQGTYRGWGGSVVVADFNGNGTPEIVTPDRYGKIYAIDSALTAPQVSLVDSNPAASPEDPITVGGGHDLDQDGKPELVVAYSTSFSDPMNDYWRLAIYERNAGGTLEVVWQTEFTGVYSQGNGISCVDYNADGREEILAGLYPNLYAIQCTGDNAFQPVWWLPLERSTYQPFAGRNSLAGWWVLPGQDSISIFAPPGAVPLVDMPTGLVAQSLGPAKVKLTWHALADSHYFIFRGVRPDSLVLVQGNVIDTMYIDSNLTAETRYWFVVGTSTQVPGNFYVSAVPSAPPRLDSAWVGPNSLAHIMVAFNEPMDQTALQLGRYFLNGPGHISSVTRGTDRTVMLGLTAALTAGTVCSLWVEGACDTNGTPLDSQFARCAVTIHPSPPRLLMAAARHVNPREVRLTFTLPVVPDTTFPRHFSIDHGTSIDSVVAVAPCTVALFLDQATPLDLAAHSYVVTADSLRFLAGNDTLLSAALTAAVTLGEVFTDFSRLVVYPNPYAADRHAAARVVFKNVPAEVTVRIFTATGELVRTLAATNSNGLVVWDLDNNARKKVASGQYMYYINTSKKDSQKGSISIIR
jgi:hypothetical protein